MKPINSSKNKLNSKIILIFNLHPNTHLGEIIQGGFSPFDRKHFHFDDLLDDYYFISNCSHKR